MKRAALYYFQGFQLVAVAWEAYASDLEATLTTSSFIRWMQTHRAEVLRDLGVATILRLARPSLFDRW